MNKLVHEIKTLGISRLHNHFTNIFPLTVGFRVGFFVGFLVGLSVGLSVGYKVLREIGLDRMKMKR